MPIVALRPGSRITPFFTFPALASSILYGHKVRIYLEASPPGADVFIANPQQAAQVTSVDAARQLGIYPMPNQTLIQNLEFTIPGTWRSLGGWHLVIGNPSTKDVVAVYYTVTNV